MSQPLRRLVVYLLATGRAAGGQRTDTGFTASGVHVLVLRGDGGALHTERFVLP